MKLSEAILKGAQLRPQAIWNFGLFVKQHDGTVKCTGTCALGAALEAVCGMTDADLFGSHSQMEKLNRETDGALYQTAISPAHGKMALIKDTIMYLNDDYGWSREEIATWLESIGY